MTSRYERIRDLIDAATHVGHMETVRAQMFAGARYGELSNEEFDRLAVLARHKRHQLRLGDSNG
jgi:hypothetical protein